MNLRSTITDGVSNGSRQPIGIDNAYLGLQSEDSARIFRDKVNRLVYALDQMAAEQASLSRFDAAIATRSVRYIVSEMKVGDKELVEIALGVTPVDVKGRPIE